MLFSLGPKAYMCKEVSVACHVALCIVLPVRSPRRERVSKVISVLNTETLTPLSCPLLPEAGVQRGVGHSAVGVGHLPSPEDKRTVLRPPLFAVPKDCSRSNLFPGRKV